MTCGTSIVAVPRGDNLVSVSATTPNPEQSVRLATAALDGFVEYVVSNDIADATVRIETYEQIRDENLDRLDAAIDELNEYVATHPAGNEENRPVNERLAIDRVAGAGEPDWTTCIRPPNRTSTTHGWLPTLREQWWPANSVSSTSRRSRPMPRVGCVRQS